MPQTGYAASPGIYAASVVIVMAPEASDEDIANVVMHIEAHGGQAFVSRGVMRTIVGVVGTEDVLETLDADGLPGVAETMRITAPYNMVSAHNHAKRTNIRVGGVTIGPETTSAAETSGVRVLREATTHDLDGLVRAVLSATR